MPPPSFWPASLPPELVQQGLQCWSFAPALRLAPQAPIRPDMTRAGSGAKTTARKLAEKTEIEEGKEVKKTYTELVCVADKDRRSSQKSAFTKGKADVNKYLTEELASLTKI